MLLFSGLRVVDNNCPDPIPQCRAVGGVHAGVVEVHTTYDTIFVFIIPTCM